jgi:sodium/proline symporter
MTREQAVLVTLVAYQVVLVAIGVLSRGRTRDGADFFLGGRGLGPLVAAISASASSSSAWTLLGVSGFAWSSGASAIWLFPACVGGFALNWYVLAPALRRSPAAREALTVTEVLAGRGEDATRRAISVLASLTVLVFMTSYVASQFQGAGKTFSETFGIGSAESVLIGAAIVVFYTLLGGFWAVSLTDTLQGLLMAGTAVLLPVAAIRAVGGFPELVAGMRAVEQVGYLDPLQNLGLASGVGFVLGLFGIGLGYPGQPHVVNRFMALRGGERELVRARRIAMSWAVVVYAGMLLLGWAGRVLFPDIGDAEVVFVTAANELYPPLVSGVMVAAVLSAIMSTADSQLLVAASSVTWDLPRRRAGGAALLSGSRAVVLVLSGLAAVAALYGPREIFSPVLVAFAALGAAFGPLLLVTALKGPVPPRRTLTAMSAGLLLTIAGAVYRSQAATAWGAATERVLPFAVALAIALWPASHAPARATPSAHPTN